jgi:hypothetical protein
VIEENDNLRSQIQGGWQGTQIRTDGYYNQRRGTDYVRGDRRKMTIFKELAYKIRCAFCLNFGALNEKKVEGHGTAYFCDDCNKAGYHPKFVHHIDEDKDKVIEVEVPQPNAGPAAPSTTDESAKQIAKAIEVDKEDTSEVEE